MPIKPFSVPPLLAFALLFGVGCVKRSYRVYDDSMQPNLTSGVSYDVEPIGAGGPILWDIVVAEEPGTGRLRAYRVAALPGERVWLDHHGLRVDGNARHSPVFGVRYSFSSEYVRYGNREYYEIPADSYFLLFDNTEFSTDSRDFGAVPVDRLQGKFPRD